MTVVDASAIVAALVGRDPDPELFTVLSGDLDAPHLLDVEVMSVLRGLELGRKLTPGAADQARHEHFAFTVTRHNLEPVADRVVSRTH